LIIVGIIIFLIKRREFYGVFAALISAILVVTVLSTRIHLQSSNSIGKANEIYNKIKQILQEWSDRY
jgi:hypothetical protein